MRHNKRIWKIIITEVIEWWLWFFLDWFRVLTLRQFLHRARLRHISNGKDWRFYEQCTLKEILKMKLDGTEEDKLWVWAHRK